MGSRNDVGGRLPVETFSGAGHEASAEAPGGPPPESVCEEDGDHDHSHVTLKTAELRRLLHPKPATDT
jgi:hypothetical protein